MTLNQLQVDLSLFPDATPQLVLPNQRQVAAHFHLTEIGLENRDFIDCGGTRRQLSRVILQILVGDDYDHRFTAGKFERIIGMATKQLGDISSLPIEIELTGNQTIERYDIQSIRPGPVLILSARATACLAPDTCAISPAAAAASRPATESNGTPSSGCC